MRTSKYHALNHLVDLLRHVGSIEYLYADFYEGSHKSFKDTEGHLKKAGLQLKGIEKGIDVSEYKTALSKWKTSPFEKFF